MSWYLKVVFDNYANFSGRAPRAEYWWFVLFNLIFASIIRILDTVLGLTFVVFEPENSSGELLIPVSFGVIGIIYTCAILLPHLAVSIRRLHDIGKSGWLLLLNLIPFIGPIIVLVYHVTDSTPEDNEYGSNLHEKPPPVSPSVKRFFFFTLSLLCFVLFLLQWSPWADAERDWKPVFEYLGFVNKVDYLSIPQHFWTSILAGFAITFFASAAALGGYDTEEEL